MTDVWGAGGGGVWWWWKGSKLKVIIYFPSLLPIPADVLCCTASILNLCGISVDRYRAITSPLEYSAKSSPKRMLTVIFVVWLGSACVSVPPLLLLGNEHHDPDDPSIPICTVSQNFW